MKLIVLVLSLFVFVMIGCTTTYMMKPGDRALLETAITSAQEAKRFSDASLSSASKASMEGDRAEKYADKAESAADRAEIAANRAERGADEAEKAAEKAVKAFEMKQRK